MASDSKKDRFEAIRRQIKGFLPDFGEVGLAKAI
jgi:hypothetical protein